jgi:hypothetical protein
MFIYALDFEGVKFKILLDERMKDKFLSFPCEWYLKMENEILFVMSSAYSKGKSYSIYLHQLILNCDKNEEVRFINGNTLDNRMVNLQVVKD